MGGLAFGDKAANIAIRSLFANHRGDGRLAQAIEITNTSVRALSHRLSQPTGTTITRARVAGPEFEVVSIGAATRAWLHYGGELLQLTQDATAASGLGLDLGELGYSRASVWLTACLGQDVLMGSDTRPILIPQHLARLLLTTDGVHDSLSADRITDLSEDADPYQAADGVVAVAASATSDDATAVIADLVRDHE